LTTKVDLTKYKFSEKVREASLFLQFCIEICFDDSGLHVLVLNWCLNCIIGCEIDLCKNSGFLHVGT